MSMTTAPRVAEKEFAERIGYSVKLHLKEPDGSFKNHYLNYETEEKAQAMLEAFQALQKGLSFE